MDKKEFDEHALRLLEAGAVIEKLPSEIRSQAFTFLAAYVLGKSTTGAAPASNLSERSDDPRALFGQFDQNKPSENVRLIAAYWFAQYGSNPLAVAEVELIARETGITVPSRVDMTLRNARANNKNLFVGVGAGQFKPTVYGESYLKETYGVKKGTKTKEE